MSSPSELSDYGDWKVICDGHGDEDKPTDDRKPLAQALSIPKTMCIMSDTKNELSTVTELVSPKLKLPQLSNDTTERVFPVRSVMSFDSTSSSALQTPSLDKLESPISPFSDTVRLTGLSDETKTATPTRSQMPNVNERQSTSTTRPDHLSRMHQRNQKTLDVSPSLSGVPTLKNPLASSDHPLSSLNKSWELLSLSEKLQQMIEEGGAVISTDGPTEGVNFSREDERDIEIQSFGALLVVGESGGNLIVQVASSNSPELLGHTPDELFELESICKILPDTARTAFLSHAEFVVDDEYDVELAGPEVFFLLLLTSEGKTKPFWCTMHTSKMYKDYIICELEPADSADSPDADSDHTFEEQSKAESFSKSSEKETGTRADPLSRSSSLGQRNEAVSLELLNALPRILRKISSAQTLEVLVHHTISILQQLTQFHRATMYHFDSDRNGVVIADDTDPSLALDSYEGFHFEESAFPGHLKKKYLRNTVSFSYRSGEDASKLVYRASINRLSLDLSHCYLPASSSPLSTSARSPIYACLSIGIYAFGKLWGLVSCQSYDKNFRLHPLVQRVSWFMSEAISSNIERLSYTLPFQLQGQGISAEEAPINRCIKTPSGDLLALFGAEYAAAFILGETKILGKPTDSQEVLVLLEYLRAKALDTVLWSTDILADFEDLDYSPGFRHLSGLLYIPLSADGHDFIIFFRGPPGIEQVSDSLGNVPEQDSPSGFNRRTEWSAAEFGKASILSLLYRTFTDIWQEKEAAMQNNQLMRLLLANSAHEFRTPLNAIINYLEIALDGTLNQETRENLSRSHSASKSLVYIINDLLDLTNAENGQNLIKDEVFSLSETLCEATDIFWEEARQKHVDLQVVQHSDLPFVLGDQRRVRQVITNLISNAIQHTSSGAVTIQSCILSDLWEPGHIAVEVAIHDTGLGMSQQTMETLFCELEQVSNKGYMQNPKTYGKNSDAATLETESVLGLGLALVARIVRNMNGQLSLKSEEGKGSCFKIRLKFPLPNEEDDTHTAAYVHSQHYPRPDAERPDPQDPNQDQSKQSEAKAEVRDGIPCHCGDENLPKFTSEPQNTSSVNVDVALKTGESRKITIAPPTTPGNNISAAEATPAKCHSPESSPKTPTQLEPEEADNENKLHILVAEDDPINSSIVKKRLEKLGYSVRMTGNGKECAAAYRENCSSFDAVLMDLQMPIVDGLSATKMIREHELQASESETPTQHGPHRKHIPVFAVSASLIEKDLQTYIDGGFDGWIMKPIDFQRVHALLGGVKSAQMRNNCLYKPGMWEIGGWFERREGSD